MTISTTREPLNELLQELQDEINSAPVDFDFDKLISKNQKYYTAPYLDCEGSIEVKKKNIPELDYFWLNSKVNFIFNQCNITRIKVKTEQFQFWLCEINLIEANNEGCNLFVWGGSVICLRLTGQFFKDARFYNTKIKIFKTETKPVEISDVMFGRVTFEYISEFKDIRLGPNVHFDDSSFILNGLDKCESEFRHMKKESAENKNDTLANFFSAWEIKSRYHKQYPLDNPYEKIFGFLYWLLNDFGLRPYLPIIYLFGVSGLILLFDSSVSSSHNAFTFLITPLKILNKDLHYKCYSLQLESFLSLLGAVLWFFSILGLRKTFKVDKS